MNRLGIAYSSSALIQVLNNIKAPYNISTPTATLALRALSPPGLALLAVNISILKTNHHTLRSAILALPNVLQILGAGNANFLLAQIGTDGKPDNKKAERIYKSMAENDQVVVRFRGNEVGCKACLRITVGTAEECRVVVEKLKKLL
jgi:histidinol-phosphate aminotransferase